MSYKLWRTKLVYPLHPYEVTTWDNAKARWYPSQTDYQHGSWQVPTDFDETNDAAVLAEVELIWEVLRLPVWRRLEKAPRKVLLEIDMQNGKPPVLFSLSPKKVVQYDISRL